MKKIVLKNYFQNFSDYDDAFHGTNYNALLSIAEHGLKKPGDIVNGNRISIVPGHIPQGIEYQG